MLAVALACMSIASSKLLVWSYIHTISTLNGGSHASSWAGSSSPSASAPVGLPA
jgi:hypothetical protein